MGSGLSCFAGGPSDSGQQVTTTELGIDRFDVVSQAGLEVTTIPNLAPPADRVVVSHRLHLLVGGVLADGNIAFLIEPQENLDAWQAGDGSVEVQPVGGVGELLALARDDRVSVSYTHLTLPTIYSV